MIYNTINDAVTIAGGGGAMLAGRYRIVRQLGAGGMGSVWLAEDTQLDNKPFAIKMLPSILVSNKRAYRQLKDEALVAMKLAHPNIVTLRAFEENNGNPFLVMDYIDGETLDDYLCERGTGNGERGNGLSEEEVVRILRPIAAALDYAHGEGVVHRDVKPANVMIRKDGHPFILDFGIAREIQETLTRVTGKLSSGTLLYMSPEQLNGEQPKPAQDIYSFAAMVYECLKGEPPFVRGQIEHQILNVQPEPLDCGAGVTGTTGVSPVGNEERRHRSGGNGQDARCPSIAASVMAGLAKKPEDRPLTCSGVLEKKSFSRAERVEAGGPRLSRPGEVDDSGRRERKESKAGAGKVLGILAVLAALVGGVWWMRAGTRANGTVDTHEAPPPSEPGTIDAPVRKSHDECKAEVAHNKVQLWEGGPYWADRNIGAEKPEDYGYYFWWGDTVGYKRVNGAWVASDGSSSNFSFIPDNVPTSGKGMSSLRRMGWVTEDNVLTPEHDAAHVQWGGGWRMPTQRELDDLCSKCYWTWMKKNGVNGYIVRGRGDYSAASIFLPGVGYGDGTSLGRAGSYGNYWSSVLYSGNGCLAWYLDFNSSYIHTRNYSRYYGQSVRPVQGFTK